MYKYYISYYTVLKLGPSTLYLVVGTVNTIVHTNLGHLGKILVKDYVRTLVLGLYGSVKNK